MFYICVFNRGACMDGERVNQINKILESNNSFSDNIGLSNVSKRLKLLYKNSEIKIASNVEGVRVNIRF